MNNSLRLLHPGVMLSVVMAMLCVINVSAQGQSQIPEEVISWPDIIYTNGTIVSMDDHALNDDPGTIYQAMAIRDEKILALGSQQQILRLKGPNTQVFDLEGRMVLPGIINSHLHVQGGFTELARRMNKLSSVVPGYYISLQVESTPAETTAKAKQAIDELRAAVDVKVDQWIGVNLKLDADKGYPSIAAVSSMMDSYEPEDRAITKSHLDKIAPDRMLYFGSGDGLEQPEEEGEEDVHNVWFEVSRGPEGESVIKRVRPFQYQANGVYPPVERPQLSAMALAHEAGIIAEDTPASHRIILLNSFGFDRTDDRIAGSLTDVFNKDARGMNNPGGAAMVKSSPVRGAVRDLAWTEMPNPYQMSKAIIEQARTSDNLWEGGITHIGTRLDTGEEVTAYYALLEERGRLPYRIGWHYEQHNFITVTPDAATQMYAAIGAQHLSMRNSSPWIWLLGIGSEGDGDSVTRACLGPVIPALPGKEDYVKNVIEMCPHWVKGEYDKMSPTGEAILRGIQAGWKVQGLHGIGAYMIYLFGQRLEEIMAQNPDMTLERIRSMRHSFSHGTMLGKVPEVVDTALKFNLYLPVDVGRSLIDETEAIQEFYGPEGFEFQAPIRSLIDAGVEVLSDTAGFEDVEVIVTRAHPYTGEVYEPNERVDRVTAIKLSLIQAAKFNMAEDLTGTLEPGKYADFIVIDRDFLDTVAVPDDELADIKVLMTNIGGEVVWTAENAPQSLKQLPHFWE